MSVLTLGMVHKNFEQVNIELSASEARYDLALESVNEVIWELDVRTKKAFVSKKFFEILHFAPNEFAVDFDRWRSLIHPDDNDAVMKNIREHMSGISPSANIEYRIRNKLGSWQWIHTKGKIVERNANGEPIRVLGTHSDIGPRKEMERILKESEQRYRMLFMQANDAILLLSNGVIIDNNVSSKLFFGLDTEELLGKRLAELSPLNQADGSLSTVKLDELLYSTIITNSQNVEWEFLHSTGKLIDALMSINLIYDEDRQIFQVILHDISERKQFEQAKLNAIVETEEQERLRLAGDLHDEVGPLLSSLNMYLSLIAREQTENKAEILENMGGILKDTIRSVREISNNISPHALNNYGLVAAINAFADKGKKLLEFEFDQNISERRLPKVIETMCYRIIKELFNNTLKYAKANNVWLKLNLIENVLYLDYKDDGEGFDFEKTLQSGKTGIGLLNILNRLKTLKANYEFNSKEGEGFSFSMNVRISHQYNEN